MEKEKEVKEEVVVEETTKEEEVEVLSIDEDCEGFEEEKEGE